jgi:predicted metal-dependent hydrolase
MTGDGEDCKRGTPMLAMRIQEKKQSAPLKVAGEDYRVEFRRSQRARRLSLKVSHTERTAILTLPEHGQIEDAHNFLARHMDWLKRQLDRLPEPAPFVDGAVIPLRGAPHRLSFAGMVRNRGVVWTEAVQIPQDDVSQSLMPILGTQNCRRQIVTGGQTSSALRSQLSGLALGSGQQQGVDAFSGGCPFSSAVCQCPSQQSAGRNTLPRLVVSGETGHEARRLTDWLKGEVRRDLTERVQYHANALGCFAKRVSVRDQSTRWGSCSTTGTLSFSWRLIFAPAHVLDYVAAHEVAHLREMNHGPKFWRLVKQTMPKMHEARCWLKRWGAELHRFRAEG